MIGRGTAAPVGRAAFALESRAQPLDGARVQLRHPRFVHAQLRANLLHRHVAEVVEAHQPALALRQRGHRVANPLLHLAALVGGIGRLGLGRHERGRQRRLVEVIARRERRRRFDRVDAENGAAQALLVGSHLGGEVGQRRLVSQLAAQRLARGLELAALTADAARPRFAAQRVDHRPAHAPLGERLELDPAVLVEAVRGIDQAEHPVLNQVADVDRVRHRSGKAASQGLHEGETGNDALAFVGEDGLDLHVRSCVCVSCVGEPGCWRAASPCRRPAPHPFATVVPELDTTRAQTPHRVSIRDKSCFCSDLVRAKTKEAGAAGV